MADDKVTHIHRCSYRCDVVSDIPDSEDDATRVETIEYEHSHESGDRAHHHMSAEPKPDSKGDKTEDKPKPEDKAKRSGLWTDLEHDLGL